jgi:hypothetical protein
MEHECMLYTHVTMTNPQTGLAKDEWACSLALIPIMVIEGANRTRGVQAAVESMRNEVVSRQDELNSAVRLGVNREVSTITVDDVASLPNGVVPCNGRED